MDEKGFDITDSIIDNICFIHLKTKGAEQYLTVYDTSTLESNEIVLIFYLFKFFIFFFISSLKN